MQLSYPTESRCSHLKAGSLLSPPMASHAPQVAGRGFPHDVPPGKMLATKPQPPVLGSHTNIPVCEVEGYCDVASRGERGKTDALTRLRAPPTHDVDRVEVRGQSIKTNLE